MTGVAAGIPCSILRDGGTLCSGKLDINSGLQGWPNIEATIQVYGPDRGFLVCTITLTADSVRQLRHVLEPGQ